MDCKDESGLQMLAWLRGVIMHTGSQIEAPKDNWDNFGLSA